METLKQIELSQDRQNEFVSAMVNERLIGKKDYVVIDFVKSLVDQQVESTIDEIEESAKAQTQDQVSDKIKDFIEDELKALGETLPELIMDKLLNDFDRTLDKELKTDLVYSIHDCIDDWKRSEDEQVAFLMDDLFKQ